MFEAAVSEGVCRLAAPGARWLATGWNGGYATADGAVNVTVPEGFDRTDLATYVADRRETAGFSGTGPALLTGVGVAHARGARCGDVTVIATAGLSNPATLSVGEQTPERDGQRTGGRDGGSATEDGAPPPGTVNLLVGAARSLSDGTLATLLATAVEAKTATLSAVSGFSGTTSDAVAVGCDRSADPAEFAGSGTAVGGATRACVRDAILESLESRYPARDWPATVADADHGTVTDRDASTFRI